MANWLGIVITIVGTIVSIWVSAYYAAPKPAGDPCLVTLTAANTVVNNSSLTAPMKANAANQLMQAYFCCENGQNYDQTTGGCVAIGG